MATPVRGSWGGLIKFTHNFPYQTGDTAVVQYTTPAGTVGEIDSYTFDATEITAILPESLSTERGYDWTFNMKVTGTRPSGTFSIQSEIFTITFETGINES